jgi:hypothetical protein
VPEAQRPAQEPLESDFDPWAGHDIEAWKAATAGSRARRPTPNSKTAEPATPESAAPEPKAAKVKTAKPKTAKPKTAKPEP